jgi:hypothetical protein
MAMPASAGQVARSGSILIGTGSCLEQHRKIYAALPSFGGELESRGVPRIFRYPASHFGFECGIALRPVQVRDPQRSLHSNAPWSDLIQLLIGIPF